MASFFRVFPLKFSINPGKEMSWAGGQWSGGDNKIQPYGNTC